MFSVRSMFGAASLLAAGASGASRAEAQAPDDLPPYVVPRGLLEEPTPAPVAAPMRVGAQAVRDSLVRLARAQIGRRYRMGGTKPETGFDCSGFVRYVMSALSIELPRTAREQSEAGRRMDIPRDTAALRPGDLLTFGPGRKPSHVGIYVGGGRFVHASTTAGRVIESTLENGRSSLVRKWQGARRFVVTGDSVVVRVGAA